VRKRQQLDAIRKSCHIIALWKRLGRELLFLIDCRLVTRISAPPLDRPLPPGARAQNTPAASR
jgi:hypothetical protein